MAPPNRRKYSSDRRERYQELRAEGKVGPQFGKLGGRPKKSPTDSQPKRAATVVAEAARANSHLISKVFTDILADPDTTDTQKVRAVKTMLGVESGEERLQREDEDRGRRPEPTRIETRADAIAILAESLSDPIVRQRFAAALSADTAE